ncbi:UDP-N-acetylglucosamine pyrophosphorylase [Novymonas esmeraldas]|uniref:UDP-N-acetylglucosamine diphosphorylase n=1 Tax=Novymonas esmeraldas TaxID=1808958 RepID=A0AAW0F7L7_9TRYP
MTSKETLVAHLAGSNQEHLLHDYDALSPTEQATLAAQILSFTSAQWKHMNSILRDSLHQLSSSDATTAQTVCITPPPRETIINVPALLEAKSSELAAIQMAGMRVVAGGEGAVLLMAGGSGTRLGVTVPKGTFESDALVSGRSLFAYHCQRVRKMEQMAAAAATTEATTSSPSLHNSAGAGRGTLPLLVMTSDQNDAATQTFFREGQFFGLQAEQVLFFRQGSLPCYDEATGRALLEAPGRLCLAPGGNGGVYESLVTASASASGEDSVLAQLQSRGVRYVQIVSVDNILARLGDPYFFGMAATRHAEVVLKTVPKVSASERVGVVAQVDGAWCVVEYTEIGAARSAETDPATGELAFNCGNIASHCCSVDFLALAARHMETSTLYHAARKVIPTIAGPAPAIKLEAFIFDVFRYAKDVPSRVERRRLTPLPDAFQIMQVDRSVEFAPIKNADGAAADTPTTAAKLLLDLHSRWVAEAIAAAPEACEDCDGNTAGAYTAQEREVALQRVRDGRCRWEVSPLVSYEGEGLTAHIGALIRRSAASELGDVLGLEAAPLNMANI